MADISPHLLLPYILAAQAQKHVTHNEAIKLLDGVVQLGVLSRVLTAPPVSPASGDRYIVGSGATGLWAGWDLNVAFYVDGAWLRLIPRVGWIAYSVADTAFYSWSGSAWVTFGSPVFSDAAFTLQDNLDATKQAMFQLSGFTPGSLWTYTLPNQSGTIPLTGMTTSIGGSWIFSNATLGFGTSVLAQTVGLANGAHTTGITKAVNIGIAGLSGSITNVAIGSAVAGALGTLTINSPTVTFASTVSVIAMAAANLSALYCGLGGATADSFNRLSINTPAVLLNNAGAGIEVTVNKAAAADDAAFAFKTGFSARALIGLLGSDDFSFKVSPDGSAWNTALTIDRSTGRPTLPQGMILGPLAADPSGRADGWLWFNTTAQRLRARADGVDFNLGPLTGTGVLTVPDNALEALSIIGAPGVVAGSIIIVSLAAVVDDDENTPELLDIVALWGEAGIDQITLNATFSDLTSGAVKINWSAN